MAELGMLPEGAEQFRTKHLDGEQAFLVPPDHSDHAAGPEQQAQSVRICKKLESLLEFNEEQSAAILRQWLYESERI